MAQPSRPYGYTTDVTLSGRLKRKEDLKKRETVEVEKKFKASTTFSKKVETNGDSKMLCLDKMMKNLAQLKKRAIKKEDFALVFKIEKAQIDHMLEMRKADPLDMSLMTNDELAQFAQKLKAKLVAMKM